MLNRVAVKHMKWQVHELAHAAHDLSIYLGEYLALVFIAAVKRGRIFKPPMRRHRFARPDRADFARSLVADRNHKIHVWGVRRCELIPALATQFRSVVAERFASFNGKRID